MALQKGDCMGPVETGLIHGYDDVRRKFFPTPEETKKRRTEADLLAKIHELQIAYASVANKLSTEEKKTEEINKRLTFMEKLFKPEFLDEANPPQKIITVHSIIRMVCKAEKVTKADLISARRTQPITRIRHIVCYLAGTLTFCSLPQIGRLLGDRDHTTVLHAKRTIAKLRASDADMNDRLTWYEKQLLASAETIP